MRDPLLVGFLVDMLRPHLKTLLKLGAKAGAKAVGEGAGKDTWEGVKDIWYKLRPSIDANVDLKAAATNLAEHSSDDAKIDAFKNALSNVLSENPPLAIALARDCNIISTHDSYSNVKIQGGHNSVGPQINTRMPNDGRTKSN